MKNDNYKIELESYKLTAEAANKLADKFIENNSIEIADLDFFENEQRVCEFKNRLKNSEEIDTLFRSVVTADMESDTNNLLRKIDIVETKSNSRRRLRRIIASAVVAAAVFAISFIIIHESNDDLTLIANNLEMQNSGNSNLRVPILINSKSETIELDGSARRLYEDSVNIDVVDNGISYATRDNINRGSGYNTIVVPAMNRYQVTLADGTIVTVAANSKLKYPVSFTGDSREVYLEGEAYFDVVKSDDKPFIVNTNESYVKVFGTQFNVNARVDSITKTILVEGSVGVGLKGSDKPIKITPNSLISLNNSSGSYVKSEVDPLKYLSWMSNYFEMIDWDINQLINELENWYNIDLRCDVKQFEDVKFNMSIKRENDIIRTITAIKLAVPIIVTIKEGGVYEIKRK